MTWSLTIYLDTGGLCLYGIEHFRKAYGSGY